MTQPLPTPNKQFMDDFMGADAPCCALGLVRTRDAQDGFFAMKPESNVPANVTKMGIGFGYRVLVSHDLTPISQFVFGFRGFVQ